ncbi:Uma2 family endonuclease [soil metagenome]
MTAPIAELPDAFRPMTVVEFNQLAELGAFDDDVQVELVGGVIVEMAPIGEHHARHVTRLNTLLAQQCGQEYLISPQNPIFADDISQPQPDLAVLPRSEWEGADAHPSTAVLVIEVALTSRRFDLGEKARRYAMAGYPEYWVVDIDQRLVHVHRDPNPDGTWGSVAPQADGTIQAVAVTTVSVDVGWVFDR